MQQPNKCAIPPPTTNQTSSVPYLTLPIVAARSTSPNQTPCAAPDTTPALARVWSAGRRGMQLRRSSVLFTVFEASTPDLSMRQKDRVLLYFADESLAGHMPTACECFTLSNMADWVVDVMI